MRDISATENSRIADIMAMGIESFNAQEKSTIITESAFTELRVNKYVSAVPPRV